MKGERMKTISATLLVLLLAAGAWADDAIPPGHLRTNLVATTAYTNPVIDNTILIRAVHIFELRSRTQ
jgi:hypothetical protein